MMDHFDEIYYSLIGELEPVAALPWVPNAFVTGSACDGAYTRLLNARDRVLDKLGVEDDPDLNRILEEMEAIQYCLCRLCLALRSK